MGRAQRRRDPTFLRLAVFAGLGGVGAIATSVVATVATWHAGHPNSTFFFFSLWGIAALAGCAANVRVYFQSGDPPPKPPRGGGTKVTPIRRLERPPVPKAVEHDREAA
jgi:hypothetical protein